MLEELTRDVRADFETELGRIQRRPESRPPPRELPPGRPGRAGQPAEGRLLTTDAAGVPRPRPPLPEGEPAVARLALRRVGRRRPHLGAPPVHRAAEPARSGHAQAWSALPRPPPPPAWTRANQRTAW